ncbi:hypothetical protein ACUXK4_003072 [Methylorubrum extorquens]
MTNLLPRDRALGYHWRVSPDLVERLGLDPGGRDATRRARRSIVAALALAAETNRPWVSYSRTRDWYAGGEHYPGCDYTYDTVVPAANALIEAGLVEEVRGYILRDGKGPQSRMRASGLFLERLGADLAVEHVAPRVPLIMKDEDGRLMPLPRTEQARRMLRSIEAANEGFRPIKVAVNWEKAAAEDWEIGPRHWKARKVDDDGEITWAHVLPTPHQYAVQICGRGLLDAHGRLYAWWMGLPSERRLELLINGDPVAEPDFECIHADLLYAIAGVTRDRKPYETGVHDRRHGKLAFFVGLNADGGREGAVRAIAHHPTWRKEWRLSYDYARQVYDAILKHNAPIADFFGSDAGVHLMGIDSRMCLKVLKGCRKAGIPALPVHDSFAVPEQHEGTVRGIMEEVLHETRVGISPGTSNTSAKNILQARRAFLSSSVPSSSPSVKAKSSHTSFVREKAQGKLVSHPVQPVEAVSAPCSPTSPPEPRTPSWDRVARERSMLQYQVRLAALFAQEDGVCPGSHVWSERIDAGRMIAATVSEHEWKTGLRAFPRSLVPDRLPGEAKPKAAPSRARRSRKAPFLPVQGRRHRETPDQARA